MSTNSGPISNGPFKITIESLSDDLVISGIAEDVELAAQYGYGSFYGNGVWTNILENNSKMSVEIRAVLSGDTYRLEYKQPVKKFEALKEALSVR